MREYGLVGGAVAKLRVATQQVMQVGSSAAPMPDNKYGRDNLGLGQGEILVLICAVQRTQSLITEACEQIALSVASFSLEVLCGVGKSGAIGTDEGVER